MKKCNQIFTQKGILLTVFVWCAENQQKSLMSKTLKMHKVIPLTACVFVETESANRDLTTVYTNENWFLILLSHVHFGDWVTEIWHFSPLKTNNSAQLRTTLYSSCRVFHWQVVEFETWKISTQHFIIEAETKQLVLFAIFFVA